MTRRLRRIALVLSLSTVASLGVAAPASQAKTGMELAVQDDAALVTQAYLGHAKAFPLLKQLETRWIRVNIGWAAVMPRSQSNARSKPSTVRYDFTAYDELINAAQANGMQLEVGLTGNAPRWATGDKKKASPYKPNAKLFREFVTAVVSHFGANVTRYAIWNEPNHTGWLAPLKSQASLYRALYMQGYAAIKAANPSAQVLIGETAPYASNKRTAQPPLTFLRALTKSGRLEADGYAHHPYDLLGHAPNYKFPGKDNVTIGTLDRLTKFLNSLANSNKLETPAGQPLNLYLTEFGYLRTGKKKVKESTRAKWLRQAYDIAVKNPRVEQMLHFLLAQPTKKYLFFDTSLVSRSGGKTASFNALADWANDNLGKINSAGG
jgi:GH35 family endo-1,4-beta-xylanase